MVKPVSDFQKSGSTLDGYHRQCKLCRSEYRRHENEAKLLKKYPQVCQICDKLKELHEYGRHVNGNVKKACLECEATGGVDFWSRRERMPKKTPDTKVCRVCHIEKPASDFHHYGKSPDGLTSYCADCAAARKAESLLKAKKSATEKKCAVCKVVKPVSEFGRNKYSPDGASYDCKSCRRAARLFRDYGLTSDAYLEMEGKQKGRCAICGDVPMKLYVDHCHETGDVRGLLCSVCNIAIGYLKDDPAIIRRAANYVKNGGTVGKAKKAAKAKPKLSFDGISLFPSPTPTEKAA